jgi:NADPH-dependent curcumin reductase CurA
MQLNCAALTQPDLHLVPLPYGGIAAALQGMLHKLDTSLLGKVPLSYFLGTLGMPGMTAWTSIKKIAEPIKQGEVAFVSGAAGAVGLVAGQLLKNVYGCKVIGSAGSDDKVHIGQRVWGEYCSSRIACLH